MERKLAAIFSTDVQGYSRLMGENEEATIRTLKTYRAVITTHIEQHRGRVVDSPGDNLLAEFASAVDAVQGAVAIQRELKTRNAELEDHRKMEFRIGLNVGDVITDEGRLYGDGVNIAARLEGLADPGGICISEAVHTQVRNKLSFGYEYIGEQKVKNIANPVPVYKVQLEPDATATQTTKPTQPSPVPTSRSWPLAMLAVVVVLVVGGSVALWRSFSPQPSPPTAAGPAEETRVPPPPDKPSIAVLPFTNMSGDPAQEYFSDGLTDTLITDLSKLSSLFVIARNSVFTYKGKAVKVDQIGRELGVQHVLESSVQMVSNRLRINTQLVDVTTGGHVWADRYDRERQDLFALQDEITQKIVLALKVKLTPEEQERFRRAPTANLDAYDAYLRGEQSAYRSTPEATAQARRMFERAIALDPQYAGAYSWLGWTYMGEWILQWSQDPQPLERAFELAHQALALDDSLPEPHMLLGYVYLWRDRQHEEAIAETERAIALDPNNARGYARLGLILSYAGRPAEAIGLVEKAMRLNPRSPLSYLVTLGQAYYLTGQHEEAIAALRRALALNPELWPSHLQLAVIYSELGQEKEAQAAVAECKRLSPNCSLGMWKQKLPYRNPPDLERVLAALRKAGLE